MNERTEHYCELLKDGFNAWLDAGEHQAFEAWYIGLPDITPPTIWGDVAELEHWHTVIGGGDWYRIYSYIGYGHGKHTSRFDVDYLVIDKRGEIAFITETDIDEMPDASCDPEYIQPYQDAVGRDLP